MSLDLAKLLPQVGELGIEAARRQAERDRRLPQALATAEALASQDPGEIRRKIERAGDTWRGAAITDEPIGASYPAPAPPEMLQVIGADGSQVYPDRHAAAHYYLINIGSLVLTHGSGETPKPTSRPHLVFKEEDLVGEGGDQVDALLIQGRRDLAEVTELADLAEAHAGCATLALLDNGLLLWIALQERDRRRREVSHLLTDYLRAFTRLKRAGAALAGVIDRPGASDVLSLLHLASLPLESITEESLRISPWRGLSDRDVFAARLPPGHRSARFLSTASLNRDFRAAGHEVQFFYLHLGDPNRVARIEVPEWVGDDPERLAWVHGGILEECRVTGFPYVLVRSHELAVVTQADRQALEDLLGAAMLRQGLHPRISQKALTKKWTSGRRRHRL